MEYVVFTGFLIGLFAAYLSALATLTVFRESDLSRFQKVMQIFFCWLLPIIGATVVLHFLLHQSPHIISRKFVPWPLKNMVFGQPLRAGGSGSNGEEQSGVHCGGSGSIGD